MLQADSEAQGRYDVLARKHVRTWNVLQSLMLTLSRTTTLSAQEVVEFHGDIKRATHEFSEANNAVMAFMNNEMQGGTST